MKTTRASFSIARKFGRLFRWAAFAAALCSMLALVAVITGWSGGRHAKPQPAPPNEGVSYYTGIADMSVIFDVR